MLTRTTTCLLLSASLCAAGMGPSPADAQALPECQTWQSKIPCVAKWHGLFAVADREETYGSAVAVDAQGALYVPGQSKAFSYIDRIILKYSAEGAPVYGFNITNVPWFIGSWNYGDPFYDIPAQKTVVDAARGRLFVLSAYRAGTDTEFWLAAHDLRTGQKLAGWMGASRFVGSPYSYRGAGFLDVDTEGNVWTLTQTPSSLSPPGLWLKKWDGSTGANITPSNVVPPTDYASVGYSGQQEPIAFGLRKADNGIFLAFTGHTKDVVVLLFDRSVRLLGKAEYSREVAAPAVVPAPSAAYQNLTDHPHFTSGFVDDDGNLLVAGSYAFLRWNFETQGAFTFPAAVKFGVPEAGTSLSTVFEYYEGQRFRFTDDVQGPWPVMSAKADQGGTLLALFTLYLIDRSGQLVDQVLLRTPFGTSNAEEPPNSGCHYYSEIRGAEFRVVGQRLLAAGTVRKKWLTCARDEEPQAFVVSYYRPSRVVCCRIRHFDWLDQLPRMERWFGGAGATRTPKLRPSGSGGGASCPTCIQTSGWSPDPVPADIHAIHRAARPWMAKSSRLEDPEQAASRLSRRFEAQPPGRFFSNELRGSVLKNLQTAKETRAGSATLSGKLVEAINAIVLERRMGVVEGPAVLRHGRTVVEFPGVASLSFGDSATPGPCSLNVQAGIPESVEGMAPGWPVATYDFKCKAEAAKGGSLEVAFDVSNMSFEPGFPALHVLQWSGKGYSDVTASFDITTKRVIARTNNPTGLVVMSGVPEVPKPSGR